MTIAYDEARQALIVTPTEGEPRAIGVALADIDDTAEICWVRRVVIAAESGWRLSVIWGSGTYSTNRDAWPAALGLIGPHVQLVEEPTTVEAAYAYRDSESIWGHPFPFVAADGLLALVELLGRLPSEPSEELLARGAQLVGDHLTSPLRFVEAVDNSLAR